MYLLDGFTILVRGHGVSVSKLGMNQIINVFSVYSITICSMKNDFTFNYSLLYDKFYLLWLVRLTITMSVTKVNL